MYEHRGGLTGVDESCSPGMLANERAAPVAATGRLAAKAPTRLSRTDLMEERLQEEGCT
jgi:hypothetical protein